MEFQQEKAHVLAAQLLVSEAYSFPPKNPFEEVVCATYRNLDDTVALS
jgi:hypothetical protein